jgi:Skp family chaperone for outer membrane proteins
MSLAAAVCVGLPVAAAAQAPSSTNALASRVVFFSPQQAYAHSVDGKLAEARLASLRLEKSKEIAARNARLKGLQDALQQRAALLAEDARRQREQEIERFQLDVQRYVEDAQAEFLGVEREMQNAFLVKLRPALDAVAKSKAVLLVLNADAGTFAWADPTLDITPDVVREVDRP